MDSYTKLYGIIGHPVRHSLSPAMHNAAFMTTGLNAAYLAFDVTELKEAIAGIRALGIMGVSVTIPHKEAVIPFLDQVDETATQMGAVNTIVNRDGKLLGYNTDWIGAVRALKEVIDPKGRKVLVLGAGGSARAVCTGLFRQGARIHIANRTVSKAKDLAALCNGSWSGLDELSGIKAQVLVNTTSVGMAPDVEGIPVDPKVLDGFDVVMDLVYSPLETRLLRESRKRGAVVINGLRMLLHQAGEQFKLWTGKEPPIDVMQEALEKTIRKNSS